MRLALCALVALSACKDSPRDDPRVRGALETQATPAHPSEVTLHERGGGGRIRYLGLDVSPAAPKAGDLVELTHHFQVLAAPSGEWDVFVHGELPNGQRVLVADHAPIFGRLPTDQWKAGEIWADRHKVLIPEETPGPTLSFWVGLFQQKLRMTVEGPARSHDGRDRLLAARIPVGPGKVDLPEVVIPRATGPIIADGKLDEPAWAKAPILTFADTMGRNVDLKAPTKLRLLYDDNNLYVSFESTDADITERYSKRDDPIYEHETVELFIMPDAIAPQVGPYVELQSSPGGVIFDAAFTGRRQGFDKSYEAGQTVGTVIDGTLNQPDRDKGWTTEWVVPWAGIKWKKRVPQPGDEWRMNAFRIEKFAGGGEFSAWSPPKVGDFHNIHRFGRMKFGP